MGPLAVVKAFNSEDKGNLQHCLSPLLPASLNLSQRRRRVAHSMAHGAWCVAEGRMTHGAWPSAYVAWRMTRAALRMAEGRGPSRAWRMSESAWGMAYNVGHLRFRV